MPDSPRTAAPANRPKAVPDAKSAELAVLVKRWRQVRRKFDELKERLPGAEVRPALTALEGLISEFRAIAAAFYKLDELYPNTVIEEVLRAEFSEELVESTSSFGALGAMLAKLGEEINARAAKPEPTGSPRVRPKHLAPPAAACFLLDLLLAKADRTVMPGDLEEEFAARLPKYGLAGARLWFWGETLRTIARRNPVCRWLLVGGLMRVGEWIFRQIGN
jgi:hypothetical protein